MFGALNHNIMFHNYRVLAIVPARSGSKGIKNKNLRKINNISLIGLAGNTLSDCKYVDKSIISTDSPDYANEGIKFNLEAPFLRPKKLSCDKASSIETVSHALIESEKYYGVTFDIVLIVEPTSPSRIPEDISKAIEMLVSQNLDSVVSVSPIDLKYHPHKILDIKKNLLVHDNKSGESITHRQQLSQKYVRNGIIYCLTRDCILKKNKIFTNKTGAYVIVRQTVNIDNEEDLIWAKFVLKKYK